MPKTKKKYEKIPENWDHKKGVDIHIKNAASVELSPGRCAQMCKKIGLEYHEGMEKRVIQYRMTDATVDRANEVVIPKGVDLKEFKDEPVVLFIHDRWAMPVGKSIKTWYDKDKDAVLGWVLFFDDIIDPTGLSSDVFAMASNGGMRKGSIGFSAKREDMRRPSPDERALYGMNEWGLIFDKITLREFSVCPIPANPNASQEPFSKGMSLREETISALLQKGIDLLKEKDGVQFFKKAIDSEPEGEELPVIKDEEPTEEKLTGENEQKTPMFTMNESEKEVEILIRIDSGDGYEQIKKKIQWAKELTSDKVANKVSVKLSNEFQQKDFTNDLKEIKRLISDLQKAVKEKTDSTETPPTQKADGEEEEENELYQLFEAAKNKLKK